MLSPSYKDAPGFPTLFLLLPRRITLTKRVGNSIERVVPANSHSFMWVGSEMAIRARVWCARWRTSDQRRQICILLLLTFGGLGTTSTRADGCFVFKWNKEIDINEPTQKAIIVHDAGRQDMLLQVKYEGPLEEFGWLIPVPSLPKVEKGSMEAFYELSRLTQTSFASLHTYGTMTTQSESEDKLKVLEDKPVGAYQVSILSAQSPGSLDRWLKKHRYSIPNQKSEIIDEYIHKGWYFVAVKIRLNAPGGLKSPKDRDGMNWSRKTFGSNLSSGELHPLLISFDTPACVFPLKISSVGEKPSEISIYVFSTESMFCEAVFRKGMEALRLEREELTKESLLRRKIALTAMQSESLDNGYFGASERLFRCLRVGSNKVLACAKLIPRLNAKAWYLTKQVWTFQASEMEDLRFDPSQPSLARMMKSAEGGVAADALVSMGGDATRLVLSALRSTNSLERANASSMLLRLRGPAVNEVIPNLLKDEVAQVRLNALMGATANGLPNLAALLEPLRRDPHPRIRWYVSQILGSGTQTGQ